MTKRPAPVDGDVPMLAAAQIMRIVDALPDSYAVVALNVVTARVIAKHTPFDRAALRARKAGDTIAHLTSRFAEARMGTAWASQTSKQSAAFMAMSEED